MDNAQSGMKARVDVKRPWLAILPLMSNSPINDRIICRNVQ